MLAKKNQFEHYSVLKNEVIHYLNVQKNGIYIDGTLGLGGHSLSILNKLANTGKLLCFDLDQKAIEIAQTKFKESNFNNYIIINDNFANIEYHLNKLNIKKVDGVVLDLGVSSMQFDDFDRGFSFREDALLDMRMNQDQTLTAAEIINTYSPELLTNLLFTYGEEKFAKAIVRKIVETRNLKPIKTTIELVNIIKSAYPKKLLYTAKKNVATKTFQALRIETNQELQSLKQFLKTLPLILNRGARTCIITFHSLEDRIVKQTFLNYIRTEYDKYPNKLPIKETANDSKFQILTKKPILPLEDEIFMNLKSRSAKLRVIERL